MFALALRTASAALWAGRVAGNGAGSDTPASSAGRGAMPAATGTAATGTTVASGVTPGIGVAPAGRVSPVIGVTSAAGFGGFGGSGSSPGFGALALSLVVTTLVSNAREDSRLPFENAQSHHVRRSQNGPGDVSPHGQPGGVSQQVPATFWFLRSIRTAGRLPCWVRAGEGGLEAGTKVALEASLFPCGGSRCACF